MGIGDVLKDNYYKAEDVWYKFVDKASEKLPVVSNVVDAVEEKGIPTFPVAIAIVLIILILILLSLFGTASVLTIIVTDEEQNPISGAQVTVFLDGSQVEFGETNANGRVSFYVAEQNYSVKIDKQGYTSITQSNISPSEINLVLKSQTSPVTKIITLKNASGQIISGSGSVIYSCVGSNEQRFASYTNGRFNVDFSDCAEIQIDSISGYTIVQGRASFSGTDDVIVDQVQQGSGTITISLSTNQESSFEGLRVMLYNKNNILTKTTYSSSNVVVFNDVIIDSYYVVVTDPNGNFSDFDGSKLGEIKELRNNETVGFNVSLIRSTSASIKITVRDAETKMPLSGVEVKRKSVENQNDLDTIITGNSGQVTFFVAQGSDYLITANHPNYIIAEPRRVSPNQEINIDLVEASESNSQSLIVRVKDPRGEGIGSTRVILKKTDDTRIDEKVTGADGEVQFFNLEFGNYFVFATKPGFGSVTTPSVQVAPRRTNTLDVTLDIGMGTIQINVNDETGILPGVSVKAINVNNELEQEKITDAQGKAEFSIRVDKEVYFLIEAPGKASYYTTSMMPNERVITQRDIFLRNPRGGLNVELIGILSESGDELNEDTETINSGIYKARLLLEVPIGNFTEAGVHIRTGKAQNDVTNVIQEDSIAIGKINSSTTRINRATTYSPPNGFNIDSKNFTNQNAKWANIIWNRPTNAIYEIEAEILITDSTMSRAENFWYRAWAKGTSNLRDPSTQFSGHELYAPAKNRLFSLNNNVGANLCTNNFCRVFSMKTLTGSNAGRTQGITNTINARQSNTYTLTAELTNLRNINGAVLEIDARGINVDEIKVNGIIQENTINLGNLGIDSYNIVEVTFTTNTPSNGTITMSINSSTQKEFEQIITINTIANKQFNLEILPRQLIPYITNTMIFEATDNNTPLPRTVIEIKKDNITLSVVETSGEGIAQFELTSPTPGDEITIIAKKEGYNDLVITKKVDSRLLLLTPLEISETIKIGEIRSINQTLLFTNNTVSDISIRRVTTTGELDRYLNIDFDNVVGGKINSREDNNFNITIRPNALAQRLMQPLTITGEIRFETQIDGVNQSFENKLPVRIRLSMPGYLDSDRCLKVNPTSIEFNTSTSEVTQTVEIENNCVAEGVRINLSELRARLNENSKLGNVMVSGTGFTNATLSETYTTIAQIFERESKQNLTVRFVPNANINSGEQKLRIDLEAKNIIDDTESETINTSFNLDLSMSNLSRCLEVVTPSAGIVLEVAGWNLGYDRLVTSNVGAHINQYQGLSGRGMGSVPFGLTQAIPFTGQQTTFYEQDNFTIRNNCAIDVEVSLDVDSRLSVSQQRMTISRDSETSITINPGYTLGRYNIGVNAKLAGTSDSMRKIDSIGVIVRKLGDSDPNCIKVNVTTLNFNSFLYKAERHKAFNYCYNTGVMLDRGNNAVTVQCEAPNALTTGVPYFQTGQPYSQLYSQHYPLGQPNHLGQTFNSYHDYLRPSAAMTEGRNTCPMVAGTRVYDRRLVDGPTGTVEELTFEVLPSAQYLPQRKLFNQQQQSFGLFNTVGDIRQWATETDARTNIYGNLAVRYTNQYGSMQTMYFPIRIEDMWRIGESIDSAVNWGDPNAKPEQCVDNVRKEDSLNIQKYWLGKGSNNGAIPDGQYRNNVYTYIAEPPAVRIGPASQTSFMSNPYGMGQFSQMNIDQVGQMSQDTANCGLLDNLSNFVYEKEIGGVIIDIDDIKKGSLINNTLGPNVAVTINRSGMEHNCVYIDMVVSADLRRAINLQKGEVSWNLKAVVTKPGYNMVSNDPKTECFTLATADIDCQQITRQTINQYPTENEEQIAQRIIAAYPVCQREINATVVKQIKDSLITPDYAGECEINPNEFGFDKIDKINLEQIQDNLENYCKNNYCNTEMFTGFIYDKYANIKEKLNAYGTSFKPNTSGMLSELYKESKTISINDQNYYAIQNGLQPITRNYAIPQEFFTQSMKEEIIDLEKADTLSLTNMVTLLEQINNADLHREIFLLVEGISGTGFNQIGTRKTTTLYVPISTYLEINKKVLEKINAGNTVTQISLDNGATITTEQMQTLAKSGRLVELIREDTLRDDDIARINRIYDANPRLKEINELTKINSVYVTNIGRLNLPSGFVRAGLNEFSDFVELKEGFRGAGQYNLEIDLNYKQIVQGSNVDVDLIFSNKRGAPRASENIILQNDFKFNNVAGLTNTIADQRGIYNNIPVRITATINAQQEALSYRFDQLTTPNKIIDWVFDGQSLTENNAGQNKIINLPITQTAKTITGTYLHPKGQVLIINPVRTGTASVSATARILSNETKTTTASTSTVGNIQFTTTPDITVQRIIDLVKNDNACVLPGQIVWNEIR